MSDSTIFNSNSTKSVETKPTVPYWWIAPLFIPGVLHFILLTYRNFTIFERDAYYVMSVAFLLVHIFSVISLKNSNLRYMGILTLPYAIFYCCSGLPYDDLGLGIKEYNIASYAILGSPLIISMAFVLIQKFHDIVPDFKKSYDGKMRQVMSKVCMVNVMLAASEMVMYFKIQDSTIRNYFGFSSLLKLMFFASGISQQNPSEYIPVTVYLGWLCIANQTASFLFWTFARRSQDITAFILYDLIYMSYVVIPVILAILYLSTDVQAKCYFFYTEPPTETNPDQENVQPNQDESVCDSKESTESNESNPDDIKGEKEREAFGIQSSPNHEPLPAYETQIYPST